MASLLSGGSSSSSSSSKAPLPPIDWENPQGRTLRALKSRNKSPLLDALDLLDKPRQLVDRTPVGRVADSLRDTSQRHGVLPNVLKFARNTAVDIAEDPLTYLSFGTKDAAATGLKAVAKHAGEDVARDVARQGTKRALSDEARAAVRAGIIGSEGGSEKAAGRVLRALDRGAQGGVKVAGRTVVPGHVFGAGAMSTEEAVTKGLGNAGRRVFEGLVPRAPLISEFGRDTAEQVGAASARARAGATQGADTAAHTIAKSIRQAKATEDELRRVVLPALDVGGEAVQVPARLQPVVDTLRAVRDVTTKRQLAAEVLPAARETETYLPRFLTPDARKGLAETRHAAEAERLAGVGPTEVQRAMAQGGHIKPRLVMPDAPLQQVENVVGDQLRAKGVFKGPMYEDNPAVAIARRAAQAEQAVAQRKFLDELGQIKVEGKPLLLRAGEGVERPAGFVEHDAGPLGKFYSHAALAPEIDRVRAVVTNDKAISAFNNLAHKVSTLWRGYATVPLVGGVGFHARNEVGNIWNNFLAGVKNPADYARAARIQATVARKGPEALAEADRRIYDLARKHGVIDTGFFATDLSEGGHIDTVRRAAKGASVAKRIGREINPLSTENAVLRSGRKVGDVVENSARLTHFIAKLGELGNAEAAANSVRKYLFDYADLTPFEREKLKPLFAFWTFMRKNTPLQIAAAAREPGKFSALAHGLQEGWNQAPRGNYPSFAIGQGQVPVSPKLTVGVDLPASAAVESVNPSWSNLINRFSGPGPAAMKALVEGTTKKSLFTGGNLATSPAENAVESLFPLYGKVKRAPYTSALRHDEQTPARLVTSLTGLNARVPTTKQKTKKSGRKSRSLL